MWGYKNFIRTILTLKLLDLTAGVSGSLTVTVA